MRLRSITLLIITLAFIGVVLTTLAVSKPIKAQSAPAVQALEGSLAANEVDIYLMRGLKQGQTIFATMHTTSGNLDPILAIIPTSADLNQVITGYVENVGKLVETSSLPLLELPDLRDNTFPAWDDDGGPGYSAALQFAIPSDGDYYLAAAASLSAGGRQTAGDYRLVIGIDTPEVLDGNAVPTQAEIAIPAQATLGSFPQINAYSDSLTPENPVLTLRLADLNPGDILSLHLQPTSGNLKPALILRDYGGKPVQVVNLNGQENVVKLEKSFPDGSSHDTIEIICQPTEENPDCGDFQLLAGVNAPQVLEGVGEPNSGNVLLLSIPVKIGFKLQQVVDIDPSKEIMNIVGTVKFDWTDPLLAFNPDDCQCTRKDYTESEFNNFLAENKGKWPDFTIFNQQGNRWTQNRVVEIEPNGHVTYLERFTTNVQLNFDFTKYPFDTENFFIYIDMLYPVENYHFINMENFNEIDPEHGEDEFKLSDFDTQISSEVSSQLHPTSRFTFHFDAPRNLSYYIFRIFVPILLIISVSYVTFFLKDFTRRIEVATGNLLLFIAFSFSLAENYPRMGYLTYLDAIMAITFTINTLVVVYSVYLKWLENQDQRERAENIDRFMDWAYPITYLVSFGIISWIFLL